VAAYPVLAHLAIVRGSEALMLGSLAVLLVPLLLTAWSARSGSVTAVLVLLTGGLVLMARSHATVLALYLPPVVINFAVAWLFGHTLAAGRVPLVERLARVLHAGEERLDPAIAVYARQVTLAWTLLLSALGSINLALALCATPDGILRAMGVAPPFTVTQELWSLVANVGSYLVVGVFFAVEYAYRRRRFPQQPYQNAIDFIRRAVAAGPQIMASLRD
jgi:uncharacterized membrane protein